MMANEIEYKLFKEYDWPCYPTGLRYHPSHIYKYPYPPTAIAYTDRLHGKSALYFPIRDEIGCIEIGTMRNGNNTSPKKRIYIDHSPWYRQYGHAIKVMDMSFGYDYQRLYVLFKQEIEENERQTYRAWVCQFDTNLLDGTWLKSQPHIPLFGFIKDNMHVHPFAPTNIDSVIEYLCDVGLTGELIDKPELEPAFNILSVYDKLFVTLPVLFKPRSTPWNRETVWTPSDARLLYQVLFMFDETWANFNSCAIIGSVSPWLEDYRVPLPDIEPKQPFKLRMNLIDDTIVWMLAHVRTFPAEWYKDWPTKDRYPGMYYMNTMWDGANLLDRFWQPLTTEAIHIDDLIDTMTATSDTYIKPFKLRARQYYTQTPLISDLYHKTVPDWTGQKAFSTLDPKRHIVQEYDVKYHNFKRKLMTDTESIGTEWRDVLVPMNSLRFDPISEYSGEPTAIPYAQPFTLKRGKYKATIRGADGGPAMYEEKETGNTTILNSGGVGAEVTIEFDLDSDTNFIAYAGKAGGSNDSGWPNGGEGGKHVIIKETGIDPLWSNIFDVTQVLEQDVEREFNVPIGGYAFFFKIPKGAKQFHLNLSKACRVHNASIQVLHTDGTLLTGTLNQGSTMWPWFTSPINNPTNDDITDKLKETYPDIFGSAQFDDSKANEGKGQIPWGNRTAYHVDGETIEWTGNARLGGPYDSPRGVDVEDLYIEEAQEDLIIGILATHYFALKATWQEETIEEQPPAEEEDSLIYGGGGGGLSGLFLADTPIAIAGSGGGGGNEDDSNAPSSTTRNGGHGGSVSGTYGQFNGNDTIEPGTQTTGFQMYMGETVTPTHSGAGGGGAGYYGGHASQDTGKALPGGGGGSSYIDNSNSLPSINITKTTSTDGSGDPGANPQDGYVLIEGSYYDYREVELKEFNFVDHDLGDFVYQCGGPVGTAKGESTSTLDVIILNDCTTSMYSYIQTLAGAMPALVNGISGGNYTEVHYAVAGYANDLISIETDSQGRHLTDTASEVEAMMTHSAEVCKYHYDNYGDANDVFGSGDAETWANAMTSVISQLGSEKTGSTTMFIYITDDINSYDNQQSATDPAIALCTSLNATVVWVLPTYYSSSITTEAQAVVDINNGTVLTVMDAASSDWGDDVANTVVDFVPEANEKIAWFHTMAIENLSCNTYIKDFHLKSENPALTLGYLPAYEIDLVSWTGPVLSEISFDEIPPHSEALFTVALDLNQLGEGSHGCCFSMNDGVKMSYYLESRNP